MSNFLKGLQQQFILSTDDKEEVFSEISSMDVLFYLAYADNTNEKKPFCLKDELYNQKHSKQFFIVHNESKVNIVWRTIKLQNGRVKFEFDPLNSKGVQFLLSPNNNERIGVGRISVCTEWKNDNGLIIHTDVEKELFRTIKKVVKKNCIGSVISRIWIGKSAYDLWVKSNIELAYDLNNPDKYNIIDFKSF